MKKILSVALLLLLALIIVPTSAFAADTTLSVGGTTIESGTYYTYRDELLTKAADGSVPTSGFLIYDGTTGTLTLNNIAVSDGIVALADSATSLTVELVGTNSISGTMTFGQNITATTFTGSGSLNVTSSTIAIPATGDLVFRSGSVTAQGFQGIGCSSLTIEDTANVTATGTSTNAIVCTKTFSMIAGTLTASGTGGDAIMASDISVTGGTLNITSTTNAGLVATDKTEIGGNADITVNTSAVCLYAKNGITVNGGTLSLTSENGNGLYTDNGKIVLSGGSVSASAKYPALCAVTGIAISNGAVLLTSTASNAFYTPATIKISGGEVKADGYYPALCGDTGIEISGGKVTAISSNDAGIYSPAKVSLSGGIIAAAGTDAKDSILAGGSLTIDGDAVVYGKKLSTSAATKGVVYTGTTVELDNEGSTVLTGGIGTVYDNPNASGFATPTGSLLGTSLDEFVTVNAQNMTYSGSKLIPTPTVSVAKIAITRDLVIEEDYTITTIEDSDYTNVGNKTYAITAISDSGNIGNKEFACEITAKELFWNTTGLTVCKTEDGTTAAAQVQGTLAISGIVIGDDVTLGYDSLTASTFPDSKAGKYTVTITVNGARITGADAGNYKLPTADISLSAEIEAASTATSAPTSAPAKAPNTGDDSHAALWFALLLAAIFLSAFWEKKRAHSEK